MHLLSPAISSHLVLPETSFDDRVWKLLVVLCFVSIEWLLLALSTAMSSGQLQPAPAGLVLLCGIHSFLLSVTHKTYIHFTRELWYAAGFLERDGTGCNVNTDDRPSNTVTLFKQVYEKVFPLLQLCSCCKLPLAEATIHWRLCRPK